MKFKHQYILDDQRRPVPCPDPLTFAEWVYGEGCEDRRRVAWTDFPDGSYLSTVFLGLDMHRSASGPVLFESAHFHGGDVQIVGRYRSWAEAELGHMEHAERYELGAKPS